MIHYVLQIVVFQLFFLIIYDVFLKNETFFNWNRAYLLITAVLSLCLPFIKFDSIKTIVPEPMVVRLPAVIIGDVPTSTIAPEIALQAGIVLEPETGMPLWQLIVMMGMLVATVIFVLKLLRLYSLKTNNPKHWLGHQLIVKVLNSQSAFSFFNTIFMGADISEKDQPSILQHEIVHVTEKHSYDLMFFELLRIVFWFNPLVYIYQSRMTSLHEFIADAKAVKTQDKTSYYENLLSQVFETRQFSFVNPFFKESLIKKRIVMLTKSRSKQIHILKYALLIPMIFGMLMYTSSYAKEIQSFTKDMVIDMQELTGEQLQAKYLEEIKQLNESGTKMYDIFKNYLSSSENYYLSKEDYFKSRAFSQFISQTKFDRLEFKPNDVYEGFKSYDQYLLEKKSLEAKQVWENNTHDGILKLVVDDFDNLSTKENLRKLEKLKLLEKDDFYKSLLITDGFEEKSINKGSVKIVEKDHVTMVMEDKVEDVVLEEVADEIEVPFAVIDEVPTVENCKDLKTRDERKYCLSEFIQNHVNNNFNKDLGASLGLQGRQRISVIFKIGKDGNINSVNARAGHPALEAEAIRVVESLPQFVPGKQKGKVVTVPYSLPIIFQIAPKNGNEGANGDTSSEHSNESKGTYQDTYDEVPFAVIDVAPTSEACKHIEVESQRKKCLSDQITSFVTNNFNTKIAKANNLVGRQRINVIFKISKTGEVIDVRARAPHPSLETEIIRVVNLLPKFTPGMQKGVAVTVPYSLPVIFDVDDKKLQNIRKN